MDEDEPADDDAADEEPEREEPDEDEPADEPDEDEPDEELDDADGPGEEDEDELDEDHEGGPDGESDEEPDDEPGHDIEDEPVAEPEEPAAPKRMGARAVARAAVEQVVEMTGKTPEGVTSVSRNEDGWVVGVEVVETERIPDSADVLAIYEAELDDEGELMSYRRVRRYARGRGDDE